MNRQQRRHGLVVRVTRGSTDPAAIERLTADVEDGLVAAGLSTDADSTAAAKVIAGQWAAIEQTTIDEFRTALEPLGIRVLTVDHPKKKAKAER